MVYVLNVNRGNTIQHPDIKLEGLTAYEVDESLANQLKRVRGVVVFDKIVRKEQ